MSDDEVLAKFSSCLEMGLGATPAAISTLADKILDLDNCADVADIVADFPALNS